jgi:hypothetical protein
MGKSSIDYVYGSPEVVVPHENLRELALSLVDGFSGDNGAVMAEVKRLGAIYSDVIDSPNTLLAFEGERCVGTGSFFKVGETPAGKEILMFTRFCVLPEARGQMVSGHLGISLVQDIAERHPGALVCGTPHGLYARKYCEQMGYKVALIKDYFEMEGAPDFFDDEWAIYIGDTEEGQNFSYDSQIFEQSKPLIADAISKVFGKKVLAKGV